MANIPASNTQPQELAIFGGTFDPIHLGHVACAQHIVDWLQLNELRLMPSHIPPHKAGTHASAAQRLEMAKLAIAKSNKLSIDARELNNNSPSYTSETLADFAAQLPNCRLYFVIGFDSLLTFTRWHNWQQILQLAHIVVCTRPGYQLTDANSETLKLLSEYQVNSLDEIKLAQSGNIIFAPVIEQDIASSDIRQTLKNLWQSAHLSQSSPLPLPTSVIAYIEHNGLYK